MNKEEHDKGLKIAYDLANKLTTEILLLRTVLDTLRQEDELYNSEGIHRDDVDQEGDE